MRKSVMNPKLIRSFQVTQPHNMALDIFTPDPELIKQKEAELSHRGKTKNLILSAMTSTIKGMIDDSKETEHKDGESDEESSISEGNEKITPIERYYYKRREPKREPVIIPERKDLIVLNQRKRLRKIYEQQAILYGVDILDDNMDEIFQAIGNREKEKRRDKER